MQKHSVDPWTHHDGVYKDAGSSNHDANDGVDDVEDDGDEFMSYDDVDDYYYYNDADEDLNASK